MRGFLEGLFGEHLHAKKVLSLSLATLGVLHATGPSIHAIGQGLAAARGREVKHGIKQVDRLLSNRGIDPWQLFAWWVPFALGPCPEAVVALDWMDFDEDDQTTLVASLVTTHGRSTPLLWLTVQKSALEGMRDEVEDTLLLRLREVIPRDVRVTILADGGWGDPEFYALLTELGFHFVVRFRQDILVSSQEGERRPAVEWASKAGHLRVLKRARVTARKYEVAAVVCVKKKGLKEAWCLATSLEDASGAEIVELYSRRFTPEQTSPDLKDRCFGPGASSIRISDPNRRDRLLLLYALAGALRTPGGAAGPRPPREK